MRLAAKAAVRRKAQSKALLFAATNARDPSGLLDPYLAMAQAKNNRSQLLSNVTQYSHIFIETM